MLGLSLRPRGEIIDKLFQAPNLWIYTQKVLAGELSLAGDKKG
jgi:hypothetical protein